MIMQGDYTESESCAREYVATFLFCAYYALLPTVYHALLSITPYCSTMLCCLLPTMPCCL